MAEILVKKSGGVAHVFLNRPARLNLLTDGMLDELEGAIGRLREDAATRVVVLKGGGKAFCAGVEMKGVTYNPLNARAFLIKLNRILRAIEMLPQPTVAAVHGACVAGGLELALACTFRIATEQSSMGFPETGLGLVTAAGTTYRLPRLVGYGKALEISLLGEMLNGSEAEKAGLVTRTVSEGALEEEIKKITTSLLSRAPLAMSFVKDALCINVTPNWETANLLEILSASVNHYADDKFEGLAAFFEKRPPDFKGK